MVIGSFGKTALTEKWKKPSSVRVIAPHDIAVAPPLRPQFQPPPPPQQSQIPKEIVGAKVPVKNGAYNALSRLLNKKK